MTERRIEFGVQNVDTDQKNAHDMTVNTLLMYSGEFTDAKGQPIRVNQALLYSLTDRYMEYLARPAQGASVIQKLFGKKPVKMYRPVSLNHAKDDALKIIGRVMALEVKEDEGEAYLFGTMRILGEENVSRVADGRLKNVSISFDYDELNDTGDLIEISYVFDGAVDGAVSFGKQAEGSSTPVNAMIDLKRVEMGRIAVEMRKMKDQVKTLEVQLKRTYNMKRVGVNLQQMVKEGLISRRDMRRLMIDVCAIDLEKYPVYLRAIRTVALSKKQIRGQVSSNMHMTAFESFMDSVVENGGNMKKGLDPKEFAKQAATRIKSLMNKTEVNAEKARADRHDSEKLRHGVKKEEHHIEDDHTIKFTEEDLRRMAGMAKAAGANDLLSFMGDCAGMSFSEDEDENNDSDEDMSRTRDHSKADKKKAKKHKKTKDESDVDEKSQASEERDEEEEEAEDNPGSRDYSARMSHLDKQIRDFKSEIAVLNSSIDRLNDTLVAMSSSKQEGQ